MTVGCLVIIVCIIAFLIEGGLLMILWNWIMPDIFGLPDITIWQSIGIILLLNLIGSLIRNAFSVKRSDF